MREHAVDWARARLTSGAFEAELATLVSHATESQRHGNTDALRAYLGDAVIPRLDRLGFECTVHDNPVPGAPPLLTAARIEQPGYTRVLGYGHGDVVNGQAEVWRAGLHPFRCAREGDRLYGRGVADNKGQHLVNLTALEAVLQTRGSLGFNASLLFEMGEEVGSPGLDVFLRDNPQWLEADVLIASDGPRLQPDTPTVFLGSRGCINFEIGVRLRDGAHHSGNWGGLLRDPAIVLANAIASVCSASGQIAVSGWQATSLTPSVRRALADLPLALPDGPDIDEDWGDASLTPAERVFGWNAFAVLSLLSGSPDAPQNAIAGEARAVCQLRFVVGTDPDAVLPALRAHLAEQGFTDVTVSACEGVRFDATRVDPDNPWVRVVTQSLERTTGKTVHVLPNLGGSLPNALFAGLPTVWIPHSYRGCSQHAPNEHVPVSLLDEGLQMMSGLYYDIGSHEGPASLLRSRGAAASGR